MCMPSKRFRSYQWIVCSANPQESNYAAAARMSENRDRRNMGSVSQMRNIQNGIWCCPWFFPLASPQTGTLQDNTLISNIQLLATLLATFSQLSGAVCSSLGPPVVPLYPFGGSPTKLSTETGYNLSTGGSFSALPSGIVRLSVPSGLRAFGSVELPELGGEVSVAAAGHQAPGAVEPPFFFGS